MDLDDLPLDVLLALQDAITDPSEAGAERARLRAAGAGFHVELGNEVGEDGRLVLERTAPTGSPRDAAQVVPLPEATPGIDAVTLPLGPDEPAG